jgi:hypothetical protein
MFYIALDFDGTLVDHRFPDVGPAVPHAFIWLHKFQELDAKLILWTVRSGSYLAEAQNFIEAAGISLWGVNQNPQQSKWSESCKAYANIYIDDAAFGCPLIHPISFNRPCVNWEIVGPEVYEQICNLR